MVLKYPTQPMPAFVRAALTEHPLLAAYEARPLGGINRAKRQDSEDRRLAQMLAELEAGDRYMSMKWKTAD
jgi:hypothetical protein